MLTEKYSDKWKEATSTPLVIHDFYVQAWRVFNFLERAKLIYNKEQNLRTITKCAWAIILNSIPVLERYGDYRSICVADYKTEKFGGGYWRHDAIENDERIIKAWKEFKPNKKIFKYKGERGVKPEDFINIVLPIGKEYAQDKMCFYEFEGYEADDLAGFIYRNCYEQKNRLKIFHTVDRDWIQLVDEEYNFYWATSRVPRANERFQNQVADNNEVKRFSEIRHDYIIEHPKDYIESKIITGDSGDNLPPNCPREYMDLVKPHQVYNIDKVAKDSGLKEDCYSYDVNTNLEHYQKAREVLRKMKLEFTDQIFV